MLLHRPLVGHETNLADTVAAAEFVLATLGARNIRLRGSFANSLRQFQAGGTARVAFIGGSITQMDGYRPMLCNWLADRFPDTAFDFVDAGISSTCSTTGAFRLEHDVLQRGKIDLLFAEFAVNDDQGEHTRLQTTLLAGPRFHTGGAVSQMRCTRGGSACEGWRASSGTRAPRSRRWTSW